jgi:hypothetical protein
MMTEGRREHPPVPPAQDSPGGEPERSGPLIVERHRKADGRLLILYRAAGEDCSPTSTGASDAALSLDATARGDR